MRSLEVFRKTSTQQKSQRASKKKKQPSKLSSTNRQQRGPESSIPSGTVERQGRLITSRKNPLGQFRTIKSNKSIKPTFKSQINQLFLMIPWSPSLISSRVNPSQKQNSAAACCSGAQPRLVALDFVILHFAKFQVKKTELSDCVLFWGSAEACCPWHLYSSLAQFQVSQCHHRKCLFI